MPSPVGHFLGAVAAGWFVAGAPDVRRSGSLALRGTVVREVALFGALGVAPDFDLAFATHRTASHSIGAVIVVTLIAAVVWKALHPRLEAIVSTTSTTSTTSTASRAPAVPTILGAGRFAAACGAAVASHAVLDWLGQDTSAPFGIMAFWPFASAYFASGLDIFMAISRRYDRGWSFILQNLRAIGLEIVILFPVLLSVMFLRRRKWVPR